MNTETEKNPAVAPSDLTDVLSTKPDDAVDCTWCNGVGSVGIPGKICPICQGAGWSELLTGWRRLNKVDN